MACSVVKFTFTFLFLVVTTVCIVRGCRCDGHVLLYLRVMCTHCTRSPYEHCMSWLARYSRWDFLKGTAEVHHIRYNHSWFQTFAVFWMLFAFFWVIPRCLNFICWRFGALCLFHLHRRCKYRLWRWNRVFRNVGTWNSGRRGITQKKEYNSHKKAKVWNQQQSRIPLVVSLFLSSCLCKSC